MRDLLYQLECGHMMRWPDRLVREGTYSWHDKLYWCDECYTSQLLVGFVRYAGEQSSRKDAGRQRHQ